MNRSVLLFFAACIVALPLFGSVSVRRGIKSGTVDVTVTREPLSSAVAALELHLQNSVTLRAPRDPLVTYAARNVSAERALRGLVSAAGFKLASTAGAAFEVTDPSEPVVTLDVKDAEAAVILKSMQRQCGIKNLVLDPGVKGSGTFLFNKVPCRQAFSVVLRSLGLAMDMYSNHLVTVERPRG